MTSVTIRDIEPGEAEALMLSLIGWRVETVAGKEHLIPTDENHPDYISSLRRLERAKAKAAK